MNLENHLYNQKKLKNNELFLNSYNDQYNIILKAYPALGVIGRVSLVFSKRGLDISSFVLKEENSGMKKILILFWADCKQLSLVKNDLMKIVDISYIEYNRVRNI